MPLSKVRTLEAKLEYYFVKVQRLYALSQDFSDSRVQFEFETQMISLEQTKQDYANIVDLLNEENLKINPDFKPSYARLDAFDQIYCKIKYAFNTIKNTKECSFSKSEQKTRLPALQLVSFDGSQEKWPLFYQNFKDLVHDNIELSPTEKVQYLVSKLSGTALKVISGIIPIGDNYVLMWDSLKNRYNDRRLLGTFYLNKILNFKHKTNSDTQHLNDFTEQVEAPFLALKSLNLPNLAEFVISHIALSKLDNQTVQLFEELNRNNDLPSFTELATFVRSQCKIKQRFSAERQERGARSKVLVSQRFQSGCTFCNLPGHRIYFCKKFKDLEIRERVQTIIKLELCKNCLGKHKGQPCKSTFKCRMCNMQHNTLLCERKRVINKDDNQSVAMVMQSKRREVGILPTLLLQVRSFSKNRYIYMRALLDSGASDNLITESFCKKHRLAINYNKSQIFGLSENETELLGTAKLTIISRYDETCRYKITAKVIETITGVIPSTSVCPEFMQELEGVDLADEYYSEPAKIDCLLGASVFAQIIGTNQIKSRNQKLVALETVLGYTIMGSASERGHVKVLNNFSSSRDDLNRALESLWSLEKVEERKHYSPEETACEIDFQCNTTRERDGTFVVSLPFREPSVALGASYERALRRYLALESKLNANETLRAGYNATLMEYLEKGYLQKKEVDIKERSAYFIPHNAVYKPEKETSKIRIVLDASAKTTSGKSLNDILFSGPNLQSKIFNLLINFRLFRVAISADIEKMFFSIKVAPEHRRFLRILYRFDKSDPVSVFEFERVPFGLACSPYLARRVVSRLFCDEDSLWSKDALASSTLSYMDDYLISVQSSEEAISVKTRLIDTLAGAGFNLTKWISNSREFMSTIPEHACSKGAVDLEGDSTSNIVGLKWNAVSDDILFKSQLTNSNARVTKRHMLSVTAALFDPLGILAPLTAGMKLLIQNCWQLGLGWDDEPPADIITAWSKIIEEIGLVDKISIPRHVGILADTPCTLMAFSDASEACYGAVIYVRIGRLEAPTNTMRILCARSRIAPLKKVSLARLELCAAHLLASLLKSVLDEVEQRVKYENVLAFSDSTITLAWIRASPHKWHTFIANRTAYIREIISPECWSHVPGNVNPSDIISRPLTPRELAERDEWFQGPQWAYLPKAQWPTTPCIGLSSPSQVPEQKQISLVQTSQPVPSVLDDLANNVSSWNRLLNVVVYVLRFAKKLRSRGPITVQDQLEAEVVILKHVQSVHFERELKSLNKQERCSPVFRKLYPFLHQGVIRVGGRLSHFPLGYDQKHPVVLPAAGKITTLLVRYYHESHCHTGPGLLLAILRQRYWIISARNLVRKVVHDCNICFKTKPREASQLMGDLPECRTGQIKAFQRTGVDYAGPIHITLSKGRGAKRAKAYICLFVCLATKALHLELATDLSTHSFLAAYKRFLARRGPVSLIMSDGGTNFVGAKRKLNEIFDLVSSQSFNSELISTLTPKRVEFRINAPASPHHGGIWESNVKSVKTHLFRVVGRQVLTYEELYTLLTQIEAILNSRPLCVLSNAPDDPTALTPAHFLTLTPLDFIPAYDLKELRADLVHRQHLVDKLVQSYWKRWHLEYLSSLQVREKWNVIHPSLEQGQVVLLKEDNSAPLSWPIGIITKVFPGSDQLTRVVQVKTKGGTYVRPIVKICPLPRQ